jgi:REP element-mobilizing transposase RayT
MRALAEFASSSLKQRPVYLSQPQADRLFDQFRETAHYRARVIDAVAVLADHIHLVFGTPGDPEPDDMLEDWKTYASRALNRLIGWRPPAARPIWWARGGSKRILKADVNRAGAIRYVRNHVVHAQASKKKDAKRSFFKGPFQATSKQNDPKTPGFMYRKVQRAVPKVHRAEGRRTDRGVSVSGQRMSIPACCVGEYAASNQRVLVVRPGMQVAHFHRQVRIQPGGIECPRSPVATG